MNKHEPAGQCSAKKRRSLAGVFLHRLAASVACAAFLIGTIPAPLQAQDAAMTNGAALQGYSDEQLDALLAPIALYPDDLLGQVLMASAYPLDVVAAARWVKDPANQALQGDALTQALTQQSWDPSVKSLVPFPQILEMMSNQLDWLQQLGYAMDVQQSDVMASIQRLRRQAEIAGQLKSTEHQTVRTEGQAIVIVPAQPNVVYVPVYNPTVVYGAWPYPAYPPVYLPPPPGYVASTALLTGLAFGTGVALTAGLWGWASPNWGYGNVHVNVNRYNTINVNRPPINNPNWRPNGGYPPAGGYRPPANGPVGRPGGRASERGWAAAGWRCTASRDGRKCWPRAGKPRRQRHPPRRRAGHVPCWCQSCRAAACGKASGCHSPAGKPRRQRHPLRGRAGHAPYWRQSSRAAACGKASGCHSPAGKPGRQRHPSRRRAGHTPCWQ